MVAGLLGATTPNASAETLIFPCGGAATYAVIMPAGVALDGKNCFGDLVIDSSVISIDQQAFFGSALKSVVIPNSVKIIGHSAFTMSYVESVTFGNSVEEIGVNAFYRTRRLNADIILPSSLKTIGYGAFRESSVRQLSIPNSVKFIGEQAFQNSSIEKISLPDSLEYILPLTFASTKNLQEVTIGKAVKKIGESAFSGSSLTSIVIPDSVESIDSGAFSNSLLSKIIIGKSIKTISDSAFAYSEISEFVGPEVLETLGSNVFAGATKLKSMSIPDELKSLGQNNYDRNFSLTQITYCGDLKGFPIAPICTPERKAAAELKAQKMAQAKAALASTAEGCSALNVPSIADNGLTVTLKSINLLEKIGSYQVSISYNQRNASTDTVIDESAFKIFFEDGSSEPQYGSFGKFYPGDSRDRAYVWEYLKGKTPMAISYDAGFFSKEVSLLKLNWALPSQTCNLKSTLEAKAAAELKAKQEAEAKAAAELKANQVAAAKAAAAKKTTITCTKGKLTKKVTATKPKCPSGYKKK